MSKFEEVAAILEKRIRRGIYDIHQRLPSEYQLAKEFGVSRLTVRKAIAKLIKEKILIKDPGKGTYVMLGAQDPKIESGFGGLHSFTEVALAHGKKASSKILQFKSVNSLSVKLSNKLELDERLDKAVYLLERIRYWDNIPMTLEKIYICDEYIKGIPEHEFEGSLFNILN